MRVIMITGASRGIGRATALALATPNTHLVLVARSSHELQEVAREVQAAGAQTTVITADLTAAPHVQRACETAAAITGQIDAVIHAAGAAVVAPISELSLADWEATLRVSLTSAFLVSKSVQAYLPAGAILVNIASVAARQAFPGWAAYCSAKAGLVAFTNVLREELRTRGIRVSVVLPAATDTAIWDAIPGNWNRQNMLQANDVGQAIAQLVNQPTYMATEELVVGHVIGRL